MIPAVADVVGAMSSHRLCHPALGVEVALEEISAGNGKRYGVVVVDACRALFKEERYKPW